jgi:prepilin-type N-terminal cleavage/methylation domain-containing protein
MRNRNRRGFTLIELLVVIGIILVLVGMAVVGYNQLDRSVAAKQTRVTLHNLAAMEVELDAEAGPDFVEGPVPPAVYATGSFLNVAPVTPTPWDVNPGQPNRYMAAVSTTQTVIGVLMRSPKNKDAVAQAPSKTLLRDTNNNAMSPPDFVDAWNNPIIFVPSGGLKGVTLTQTQGNPNGATYTVRSSGVYPTGSEPGLGPKDRPFWASAGQDGDFSKGDDNVYSFQD